MNEPGTERSTHDIAVETLLRMLRRRGGLASVAELQEKLREVVNIPFDMWREVIAQLHEDGKIEHVLIHANGEVEVPLLPVTPPDLENRSQNLPPFQAGGLTHTAHDALFSRGDCPELDDPQVCPGCGEEYCGPCRDCEGYGCTCGGHENIMIYADSDAINSDYHFEKEAMGHWYCDSCAFAHEIGFDERECVNCGGNQMAAAPCAHCGERFCLECDGGTFADESVMGYDFPEDALNEFYCEKCVILYERS